MRALFRFRLLTLILMTLIASGFVWMNMRSNARFHFSKSANWFGIISEFGWPCTFKVAWDEVKDDHIEESDRALSGDAYQYIKPEYLSHYEHSVVFDDKDKEWRSWGLAGSLAILIFGTLGLGMLFEYVLCRRDRAKSPPPSGA